MFRDVKSENVYNNMPTNADKNDTPQIKIMQDIIKRCHQNQKKLQKAVEKKLVQKNCSLSKIWQNRTPHFLPLTKHRPMPKENAAKNLVPPKHSNNPLH